MKNKVEDNHFLKEELYKLMQVDASYFEFIQNGSLDGIWYWNLESPDDIWMSPRFWETLGYNPAEKKHLSSEWQNIIFPDDLKVAIENLSKHLEDSKYPYDQIVRYKHQNGSTIWVRCRGIAIRNKNGDPIRMLGAHNDVTVIMNLKQELTERDNQKLLNENLVKKPEDEIRLYDHVYYNTKSKTIRHKDSTIKLTDQEISLLESLIQNTNAILSFNQIEYLLNSNKFLTNNAISLIISRLRKKLPIINIKTIYGQGYMLIVD